METGGRWSEESVDVLRELSHAKAQEAQVDANARRDVCHVCSLACGACATSRGAILEGRPLSLLICLSQTPGSLGLDMT